MGTLSPILHIKNTMVSTTCTCFNDFKITLTNTT